MKTVIISIVMFLSLAATISAQSVGINDSGATPDASSILDVSSNSKGVLVPRLSSTQRQNINSPALGLLVFDNNTESFWYYQSSGWTELVAVDEIDDLMDGKYDGSSLFLGEGAGVNDDGNLNQNVALGKNALSANTSGYFNTATGYDALLSNTTGIGNTANGHSALLSNTIGTYNSAYGFGAMYYNTTGVANSANGYQALFSNTTGANNTAIGYQAMHENTSADNNSAFGNLSLFNNSTGISNTATGSYSLNSNTTGSYNNATGFQSLLSNTTGNFNIANGLGALHGNTTGSNNVGIGYAANQYNQTGSNNTIIGNEAGKGTTNHSKSGNVFLGYRSGFNETGNNKLYIENSNSATPLIWGDFSTNQLKVNGDLEVTNSLKTKNIQITSAASAGKILTSDATGNGSWQALSSLPIEIDNLLDGKTIANSTYLGIDAGDSDVSSSNTNVGLGNFTLNSTTTGTANVAVGYNSMRFNTWGGQNTGLGQGALYFNSKGNGNVAVGYQANHYNELGSNNTIIGSLAGRANALHDKSGNVFIGYQAGYNETADNKLYIDNSATTAPLIYGDFGSNILNFNGNVGISSPSPSAGLHVKNNDGVLFEGTYNSGAIPKEGIGIRMMWFPKKAAFRVGEVDGSFADYWDEINIGSNSIAMGFCTKASGPGSVAIGTFSVSSGNTSMALGHSTEASGHYSTAMGYETTASSTFSISLGFGTQATGEAASSLGKSTTASGNYSTATGEESTASGIASTAMGKFSTSSGNYSLASGWGTDAIGLNSTAMGYSATASGSTSTSFGSNTTASGNYSVALGVITTASGENSTAMGYNTTAGGDNSTAMGYNTIASGDYSTAMGYNTTSSGLRSTALGNYVSTLSKQGSLVIGDNSTITVMNSGSNNQMKTRFDGGYWLYSKSNLTTGVYMSGGTSGWTNISDKNKKENFEEINDEALLQKIRNLSVTKWNYKNTDPTIKYIGPMAQDFYQAFHLGGTDSLGINSISIDGVNLAGVKALEKRTADQQKKIENLEKHLSDLQQAYVEITNEKESLIAELDKMNKLILNVDEKLEKLENMYVVKEIE